MTKNKAQSGFYGSTYILDNPIKIIQYLTYNVEIRAWVNDVIMTRENPIYLSSNNFQKIASGQITPNEISRRNEKF